MGLRTEKGLQYRIARWFWKIRENMLYSDIQDIEHGIDTLSKPDRGWNKFSKTMYQAEMNTTYTTEENLEIMKLLIKQKKEFIETRRRHAKQIHDLNVKFNNNRGIWSGDPNKNNYKIMPLTSSKLKPSISTTS